jgi:hypothetical protein
MNELAIFFACEICLITHVCDGNLIVTEGTFTERTGVVAGAAIELEQPTAGNSIVLGRRVSSRRIDGDLGSLAVVTAYRMWRKSLAARGEGKEQHNQSAPPVQVAPRNETVHRPRPPRQKPQTT